MSTPKKITKKQNAKKNPSKFWPEDRANGPEDWAATKFKDDLGRRYGKFSELEKGTSQGPVIFLEDGEGHRLMAIWRSPDHEHGEGFATIEGQKFIAVKR